MRYVLLLFFLVACQTPKAVKETKVLVLPAYLHSHFDQCLSDNGTLEIEGSKKNEFSFSGEVDWRIDAKQNFAFEVVNTVGQGLWKVDREGTLLDISGLYAEEMPQISIEESTEKVLVGRYFAGMLITELPCLFKFKLPSKWQAQIVKSEPVGKKLNLEMSDAYRKIKVQIDRSKGADLSKVCSTIEWTHFLGLSRQKLLWCYEKLPTKRARYRATFQLNDDVKLKWSTASEG